MFYEILKKGESATNQELTDFIINAKAHLENLKKEDPDFNDFCSELKANPALINLNVFFNKISVPIFKCVKLKEKEEQFSKKFCSKPKLNPEKNSATDLLKKLQQSQSLSTIPESQEMEFDFEDEMYSSVNRPPSFYAHNDDFGSNLSGYNNYESYANPLIQRLDFLFKNTISCEKQNPKSEFSNFLLDVMSYFRFTEKRLELLKSNVEQVTYFYIYQCRKNDFPEDVLTVILSFLPLSGKIDEELYYYGPSEKKTDDLLCSFYYIETNNIFKRKQNRIKYANNILISKREDKEFDDYVKNSGKSKAAAGALVVRKP